MTDLIEGFERPLGETDVAEMLGVSPSTLKHWRHLGVIPASSPGWFTTSPAPCGQACDVMSGPTRVGEVGVNHRPRRFGQSKFGASRFVNGFLDLLTAAFISTSALKPLHVFGRIGLAFFLAGFGLAVWFVVQWAHGEPLRVRPLMLFGAASVLLGIQFILMGLLGEMIAHQSARNDYPVRRRFNA